MSAVNRTQGSRVNRLLDFDLSTEIRHAVAVSNLAYRVAQEMKLPKDTCYQMSIAGMLHDIGKLKLKGNIYGGKQDPLMIEEMKYVRMHSALGYEELKNEGGYSEFVLQSVLHHHENYDGTGYPSNLAGEEIPIGARILRVCDIYCALRTDRPYRKSFPRDTVIELMINEIKNFDMEVFLAFRRVLQREWNADMDEEGAQTAE